MENKKLFDLENDGLNMATDGHFLYARCKRDMHKYSLTDMSMAEHNIIFKKDGKARGFSIYDNRIFLTDFCDLYILNKGDLQIQDVIRLGADLSSDIWGGEFDNRRAYIAVRNGKIAVIDINTKNVMKHEICDSSFWDFRIAGNCLYAGTVNGELIEVDTEKMQAIRKTELCKKNICSIALNNDFVYVVSQDMTIKIVNINSFETVCVAKKAVKGMARILGFYNNLLIVADRNIISLWDIKKLELHEKFDFPTGQFNKGVLLYNNTLIGSDFQSVYSCTL